MKTLKTLKSKIRYREEFVAGRILKYFDVIADIELHIAIDLPLKELPLIGHILPNIQTNPDHPLGVLERGLRISYAYNIDDFTPAELGPDRKKITFGWPEDYFFDLSDQSIFKDSPILLTKFGFGRWDQGVWIDLGLKLALTDKSAAAGARLYFLAAGQHFAWGYPDQPPLVPLVARLMDTVAPGSVVALRAPAVPTSAASRITIIALRT